MGRIVIGNWKMNLNLAEATVLAQSYLKVAEKHPHITIVAAPSLPWIVPLHEAFHWQPPNFAFASQVVSGYPEGAYTGDIAASQLKGLVKYALVGHSERRRYHHEGGSLIADAVKLLLGNKITPVVCFGEMAQSTQKAFSAQITLDLERDLVGLTPDEVGQCLFAYEPLWAIGTGHPASPDYIHKVIASVQVWSRGQYGLELPILYGGSVTEDDAQVLGRLDSLRGLLVGGASLHARPFDLVCSRFAKSG